MRFDSKVGVAAWVLVLGVLWAALAALGYSTRDADSRLYAQIAERMSQEPMARWIAPVFPPGWFMSGPFREHPAGFFFLPALLGRLGYPAGQAAYAMGALYVVATILLLQRLAAIVVPADEARVLGWAIQLLPVAFTYRIRANHEQAVLLCLVLALLGLELARRHIGFAALTATGLVGLLLVKGIFAVFGPLLCVVWLILRRGGWRPWIAVALGVLAMGVAGGVYEQLHRSVTGEPFWSFYVSRQMGVAGADPIAPFATAVFYLGRAVWFAFPWSLALVGVAFMRGTKAEPSARAGALFAAATMLLYVGAFSLSARKAERYIFPVYYALGAAGSIAAVRAWPRLRRLAQRLDQPWVPAAVFAVTCAAHLAAGRLGVPTVKIWTPS